MPHRKEARLRELAGLMAARIDELRAQQRPATKQSQKAAFRSVADDLPMVIWTCGPDGIPTYLNRHWHNTFGENAWYLDIVHPDDRDGVIESWRASIETSTPYSYMARFRLPDGTYRTLMSNAHPFFAEDGTVAYWIGSSVEMPKAITHQLRSVA